MKDLTVTVNVKTRKIKILVLKARVFGRAILFGHSENKLDVFIENEIWSNFDNYFKLEVDRSGGAK